jgi:serine/arginine repetitive matrix protein 2
VVDNPGQIIEQRNSTNHARRIDKSFLPFFSDVVVGVVVVSSGRRALSCSVHSTLAVPRLKMSRFSYYSQRSGTDHNLLTPQAGPSRLSAQTDAFDATHDDDDNQPTPRVTSRPPLDSYVEATPSQSTHGETGAARLRAVMALQSEQQQPSRKASPPRPLYPASDLDSDFESPHATVSHSVHMDKFKDLFAKVRADMTPEGKKRSHRRNSIDSSEVEDSPRAERVQEERAQYKGKRRSMSDEEAEIYTSTCFFLLRVIMIPMYL